MNRSELKQLMELLSSFSEDVYEPELADIIGRLMEYVYNEIVEFDELVDDSIREDEDNSREDIEIYE